MAPLKSIKTTLHSAHLAKLKPNIVIYAEMSLILWKRVRKHAFDIAGRLQIEKDIPQVFKSRKNLNLIIFD